MIQSMALESFGKPDSNMEHLCKPHIHSADVDVDSRILIDTLERDLVLEGLVKAQGFDDAVVTMSEDNINVVVSQSELTSEQVAGILSVILAETDYSAAQVVVIPYVEE